MGHSVTIGGERLGAGKKMKAYLHNYERSTHDMSYVWRSTMASGTLVPFLTEVALPGDTFDIDLNVQVLTHPTIGPLFGTYKIQLDVFQIPIRLYQGKLHMNMLGIGMEMSKVALPQMKIAAAGINPAKPIDNQQINPSSLFSYLGIRGVGINLTTPANGIDRNFNAIPYLAYWDIYKNYYANKQEEKGSMIHKDTTPDIPAISSIVLNNVFNATTGVGGTFTPPVSQPAPPWPHSRILANDATTISINGTNIKPSNFNPNAYVAYVTFGNPADPNHTESSIPLDKLFTFWEVTTIPTQATGSGPIYTLWSANGLQISWIGANPAAITETDTEPLIVTFPLENIDTMRRNIMAHLLDTPYQIDSTSISPYGLPFKNAIQGGGGTLYSQNYSQEGLALKTYQSDLFNNWISTEWIDGPDGISELTKVDTTGNSFTIDELNMSRKIYDMLNRIAISGGSYDDWLDAVYTHERNRSAENPMYIGGLIRNLVFQEVISNSATLDAPLGTLAGRGTMGQKHKGGKIIAKVDEPSYLMGIISLTPNIDYSQGNKWDTNLKTLNDLHKPALDEIGFQDLITDQMAWFDTSVDPTTSIPIFKSAGKQPAWLNYMTNINVVKGNFADQTQQMFMVLNRRYETKTTTAGGIQDLTTYIDPTKYNHIFADTRRDSQNFWAQIGVHMEARRKMSAKVMPNL